MAPKPRPLPGIVYGLPFLAFMIMGWYGLASVVQSKRDLRVSAAASRVLRRTSLPRLD